MTLAPLKPMRSTPVWAFVPGKWPSTVIVCDRAGGEGVVDDQVAGLSAGVVVAGIERGDAGTGSHWIVTGGRSPVVVGGRIEMRSRRSLVRQVR